ncbi:MAG TPA: signal peptidase I [Bryobacteraceae bacterium]|nr:signal peptidase I [Bryobacteraceae bacterium]
MRAWARDLSLSLFLAAIVILFLYQPIQVEGTSMMPSLVDQERIFIDKFTYKLGTGWIQRGDLVVFWFPGETGKSYIKRVIGLPGDMVSINRGVVYVNGDRLVEEYVPPQYRDAVSLPETRVKSDSYFVLGDHRTSSSDSRSWGPVHRGQIYGKAVFVYWPLDRIGPVR